MFTVPQRRSFQGRWTGVAAAVCVLGLAGDARADLDALARDGAKAAREGRWAVCVTTYTSALPLGLTGVGLGELGLCEERLARYAAAWTHLRQALTKAPSPIQGRPWSLYRDALIRVTDRVALVSVTATPSDARVLVDGLPAGRADGAQIALSPGEHRFLARLPGHNDAIKTIKVTAGELPNVHLTLTPAVPVLSAVPRLEYTRGPAECPTEEAFRVEVALAGDGSDRLKNATGKGLLRVSFRKIRGGYEAQIELTDEAGVVHSKAEQQAVCEVSARSAAFHAHYFLPVPVVPENKATSKTMLRVSPEAGVKFAPSFRQITHTPVVPRSMDFSVFVGAYALAHAEFTADIGGGFGIVAGIQAPYVSVALEFRGIPPGRMVFDRPIRPGEPIRVVEGRLAYYSGLLVPCFNYEVIEPLILQGCFAGNLGVLVTSVEGIPLSSEHYAIGPRFGAEVRIGPHFALFAFGEALFPTSPLDLYITTTTPENPDLPPPNVLWSSPVVSGFIGIGAAVRFK